MRQFIRFPTPSSALTLAAGALTAFALAPLSCASAYTLDTLHSFCAWANCGDGAGPSYLLRDQAGNLYGMAYQGGKYGGGAVFKLLLNPDTGKYKEYVLHNFCAKANCADGKFPLFEGQLVVDVDGNLYGTTYQGGTYGGGVAFKLTHGGSGWSLSVVHAFCAKNGCSDGNDPEVGLTYRGQATGAPWDEVSPLFGTTMSGGTYNNGTAYELTSRGGVWSHAVIHNFDTAHAPNGLIADAAGNLYGTVARGGKNGDYGIMFKLAHDTWAETVLHNFCSSANCADGKWPYGRLLMDASGNLFGTASEGGAGAGCTVNGGCGVVFERTAGGTFSAIYNFCSLANCSDGQEPVAGLIVDSAGNFFGTTWFGGAHDLGTVFSLPKGQFWTESVLYSFCSKRDDYGDCLDGFGPEAPVVMDSSGNLYGITVDSGDLAQSGTVFELKP